MILMKFVLLGIALFCALRLSYSKAKLRLILRPPSSFARGSSRPFRWVGAERRVG